MRQLSARPPASSGLVGRAYFRCNYQYAQFYHFGRRRCSHSSSFTSAARAAADRDAVPSNLAETQALLRARRVEQQQQELNRTEKQQQQQQHYQINQQHQPHRREQVGTGELTRLSLPPNNALSRSSSDNLRFLAFSLTGRESTTIDRPAPPAAWQTGVARQRAVASAMDRREIFRRKQLTKQERGRTQQRQQPGIEQEQLVRQSYVESLALDRHARVLLALATRDRTPSGRSRVLERLAEIPEDERTQAHFCVAIDAIAWLPADLMITTRQCNTNDNKNNLNLNREVGSKRRKHADVSPSPVVSQNEAQLQFQSPAIDSSRIASFRAAYRRYSDLPSSLTAAPVDPVLASESAAHERESSRAHSNGSFINKGRLGQLAMVAVNHAPVDEDIPWLPSTLWESSGDSGNTDFPADLFSSTKRWALALRLIRQCDLCKVAVPDAVRARTMRFVVRCLLYYEQPEAALELLDRILVLDPNLPIQRELFASVTMLRDRYGPTLGPQSHFVAARVLENAARLQVAGMLGLNGYRLKQTFTSLLVASAHRGGDSTWMPWPRWMEELSRLGVCTLPHDADSLSLIMSALSSGGRSENALSIIELMLAHALPLSDSVFLSALVAISKSGHQHHLRWLTDKWREWDTSHSPSDIFAKAFARAALACDDVASCRRALAMLENGKISTGIESETWRMRLYHRLEMHAEVLKVFNNLEVAQSTPFVKLAIISMYKSLATGADDSTLSVADRSRRQSGAVLEIYRTLMTDVPVNPHLKHRFLEGAVIGFAECDDGLQASLTVFRMAQESKIGLSSHATLRLVESLAAAAQWKDLMSVARANAARPTILPQIAAVLAYYDKWAEIDTLVENSNLSPNDLHKVGVRVLSRRPDEEGWSWAERFGLFSLFDTSSRERMDVDLVVATMRAARATNRPLGNYINCAVDLLRNSNRHGKRHLLTELALSMEQKDLFNALRITATSIGLLDDANVQATVASQFLRTCGEVDQWLERWNPSRAVAFHSAAHAEVMRVLVERQEWDHTLAMFRALPAPSLDTVRLAAHAESQQAEMAQRGTVRGNAKI